MKKHRCPICSNDFREKTEFFPFCSQRCKLIDLGNWASGKYVISRPIYDDEELEDRPLPEKDQEEEQGPIH